MIEVQELTKSYRARTRPAVDRLSFTAGPGSVTGFLGPNGAGKTTTLRILLGLAGAERGSALIGGHRYRDLPRPATQVGALLDAAGVYGPRRARDHLRWLARSNGIAGRRVDEVLGLTGLSEVAGQRIRGYSLGMRQRLGLAAALLGDPAVLILDEPVNGLDADGIRWIRSLLRGLADGGRTVLVSSHLMAEVERTADRLVVICDGRLLADTSTAALRDRFRQGVRLRSPRAGELATLLAADGAGIRPPEPGQPRDELVVDGPGAERIGDLAAAHGIPVWQIETRRASLEDAYLELIRSGPPPHPESVAAPTGRR